MPPRLWLTLSDHLFAGRVARMFHVEHLTSGLPGRSLVLAKVTSPVGVTLARSLRSRLARLFHVEHWTTTPARTKCGWSRWRPHWEWTILPPSSVPTEPCSNVPRGTLNEWAAWAKSRSGQSHVASWSDPCSLTPPPPRPIVPRGTLDDYAGADKMWLVKVASALGMDHLAAVICSHGALLVCSTWNT